MTMKSSAENKNKVIQDFQVHDKDTGSARVQIALLTDRINHLNEDHFKSFPKDRHSRVGLMKMVGKRRKLLRYLKDNNPTEYQEVLEKLNLRR